MMYERNGKRYEVGDRISVREGTRVKWYEIADFKLNGSILVKYWENDGPPRYERAVFRVVQPDTLGLTPIKSV